MTEPAPTCWGTYEGDAAGRIHARASAFKMEARKEDQPMDKAQQKDFFQRVWDVVEQIPEGKVTTYGHIARHLGLASSARTVGWALQGANRHGLPCHRVVNRYGALSGRMHFETPYVMEERLRGEGVTFTDDGCVDLSKHLWIPGSANEEQR